MPFCNKIQSKYRLAYIGLTVDKKQLVDKPSKRSGCIRRYGHRASTCVDTPIGFIGCSRSHE
jgi:hypothetical protein